MLLSDKTTNVIRYEADAILSGDTATFTIPSGVNICDYSITAMLTTDNGGYCSETVYNQYSIKDLTISYYGYINGNDSPDFNVNGGSSHTITLGGTIYSPKSSEIKSNHIFLGWTTDKTGASTPFKTFPSDFSSSMKVYAVWEVDTITAGLTVSTPSVEYLIGKIRLDPDITADNMSDLEFTKYDWKKGGSSTGDTSDYIELENVSESGTYSLGYTIRSQSEPLWRHSGTTSSETVTITPGQLTPQSLSVNKTAYYGMDLGVFTPTAVMHNSKGEPVSGTTHWVYTLGKINDTPTDPNYIAGKYYAEFYFVPDSSYNGNYASGDKNATVTGGVNYNELTSKNIVYFDVEHLKVIFNLTQLSQTLSFDLTTYNGPVSYSKIAKEFDTLWAKYYADNKTFLDSLGIGGYTPQFKHADGRFYNISNYRTMAGGYDNVTADVTVEVKFVEATYSVTYKYDDEAGTPDKVESGKLYGQQLLKPSPNPTNGALMFLGWYYPATDENGDPIIEGGVQRLDRWDFDVNCVFGDTVLTARWLKAERLDRIEVMANKPNYTALKPIGAGDLIVTAYFIAKDEEGKEVEMPVVLEFSEYKDGITYVGNLPGDTNLHVNADGSLTQIKVKYSYFNDGTDYSFEEALYLEVT
ncbi:MAG: hypothetical protein K2N18_04670, partial [Clostridia bacterium]|nr:hypothetical protein [Clostridia bacterium]